MTGARKLLAGLTQRSVFAAALVIAVGSVIVSVSPVVGSEAQTAAWMPGAPAYTAAVPCRQDTFAHVHHPSRLLLISPCATVIGVVDSVSWQPIDGDWRLELTLDPSFSRYLPDRSQRFGVEVIPPDVATVRLPNPGDRIAASGAWVRNRNRSGAPELHPTWSIQPVDQIGNARVQTMLGRSKPDVNVHVDAPTQTPVGEAFTLLAAVTEVGPDPVPVPLAHLWLEVLPRHGPGVQWKAEVTNSLGVAVLEIVALYRPGPYELHVYVERQGRVTSIVRHLEVVT